jgi:hypothetical protein
MSISMPSERVALKSLAIQGADFALDHVLNVMASSQVGQDWKPVVLPPDYFVTLKPVEDLTMSYRIRSDEKGRFVLDIRADSVFVKVSDCFGN